MAIKKFRVRNMILLHEAQTSSKVTKIGPVGFWKDSIVSLAPSHNIYKSQIITKKYC